ncbi:MAG: branched-chain amino acid aminotransferase [Zetaproteobacteria bacterium]|nr:MAG: branched-chain amino acid aminotransferase [Zetaproteobacteria bacterium]
MGGLYHEAGANTSIRILEVETVERGLAYAEGCFETFRVVRGEVFAWDAHAARLCRGLAAWGYDLTPAMLSEVYQRCLARAAAVADDALVRLTVSPGPSPWGILRRAGNLVARVQAMSMPAGREPFHLRRAHWPWPPLPREAKYLADYARLGMVLHRLGTQDLVFIHQETVLSAAVANVLIYRDGQWWTPTSGAGVLPGVVRAHLLTSGVVREAVCPAAWLDDCEGMALANSGMFVRPVATLDGRNLPASLEASAVLRATFPPSIGRLM